MNVVLDTNVLIMSISKGSPFHSVWTEFLSGRYTICYTTEILLEYEEVLARKVSSAFANAHYIVSEDHHYDLLRNIDYPRIEATPPKGEGKERKIWNTNYHKLRN